MATIIHKVNNIKGKVPIAGDLSLGELAINSLDGKIFLKRDDGIILNISGYNYVNATSNYTAKYRDYIYCDGGVDITLPATPNNNDVLVISDYSSSFHNTNVNVIRNGSTILGIDSDIVLDTKNNEYRFTFLDGDWKVQQSGFGASELAEDVTPELSGDLDALNNSIKNVKTVFFNGIYDNGTKTTNFDIYPINGQYQKVSMDGSSVMNIVTPPSPCTIYLHIYHANDNNILTYPSAEWVGGIVTDVSTELNAHDLLMIHYTGSGYVLNLMKDLKTP